MKKNQLFGQKDEQGLISLIVVVVLSVVLSLIAVGFSKLADRELRQASDRESQTQAFFAAESGINDALAYLTAGGTGFSGCSNWPTSPVDGSKYFVKDLSNGTGAAKYSCISIDDTPQTLSYIVKPGKPVVVKVNAANLNNLYFGWQDLNNTTFSPLGAFKVLPTNDTVSQSNPNAIGLLRVGIYPAPAGSTTNDNLAALSRFYYLYPNAGTGNISCPGGANGGCIPWSSGGYSSANGPSGTDGSFISGNCVAASYNPLPANKQEKSTFCNSEISGLGSANSSIYYLYLTAQYEPLQVYIQATDNGGGIVKFTDTQGVVDVTGQGADQIQRVRARVNLISQFNEPGYAIQSMETLCKNFTLEITQPQTYGNASILENPDNACSAPNGGGSVAGGGVAPHP